MFISSSLQLKLQVEKLIEYVKITLSEIQDSNGVEFCLCQFYDSSYVNKAIELLNGKKLFQAIGKSWKLKITRCKKTFTPVNGLNDNKKVTALNDKQESLS